MVSRRSPTTPRRSVPRAVFIDRPIAIADFFHRVGRVIYAPDWKPTILSEISGREQGSPLPGSNREMAEIVASQIVAALQIGIIRAVVPVTLAPDQRSKLSEATKLGEDDESFVEDLEEEDFVEDRRAENAREGKFLVCSVRKGYWLDGRRACTLDWIRSTASFNGDDLRVLRTEVSTIASNARCNRPGRSLRQLRSDNDQIALQQAPVWIDQPVRALRTLLKPYDLPDEEWFARYKKYQQQTTVEMIAAGWRFLAICHPAPRHGLKTEVSEAMRAYLASQCLPEESIASEAKADTLASEMIGQYESGNLSASILVRSNPNK